MMEYSVKWSILYKMTGYMHTILCPSKKRMVWLAGWEWPKQKCRHDHASLVHKATPTGIPVSGQGFP